MSTTTAPANPVRGGADEHKILADNKYDQEFLGADDQNFKPGALLTIDANTVKVAQPGDVVWGICKSSLVTYSDNTTYHKKKVLARRIHDGDTYRIKISLDATGTPTGPLLQETDNLSYFNFDAEQFIDSASADPADDTLPFQLLEIFEGGYEGEFIFTGN